MSVERCRLGTVVGPDHYNSLRLLTLSESPPVAFFVLSLFRIAAIATSSQATMSSVRLARPTHPSLYNSLCSQSLVVLLAMVSSFALFSFLVARRTHFAQKPSRPAIW